MARYWGADGADDRYCGADRNSDAEGVEERYCGAARYPVDGADERYCGADRNVADGVEEPDGGLAR